MKRLKASTRWGMNPHTLICALLALGALLAAPQVNANTVRSIDTIYDFYLGGIKAGEVSIDTRVKGKKYKATSVMKTAGIVGMLYKASFEARTNGVVTKKGYRPKRFVADSRMSSKEQKVDMRFARNAPRKVKAVPAFDPRPWQIDPKKQTGTVDPITAAISSLAPMQKDSICNRSVEIFDGRKRYAVDLGKPVADGDRIKCSAVFRRIAGYKPKMMKKRSEFPFNIWYEERPDGLAHVVRAAGDSVFGLAVILLRE